VASMPYWLAHCPTPADNSKLTLFAENNTSTQIAINFLNFLSYSLHNPIQNKKGYPLPEIAFPI